MNSNLVHICPWVTATQRPNFGLFWFMVWPPGGQTSKLKKCDFSLNSGPKNLKKIWWVLLPRGHHISYGFLIWPTFQGHWGQNVPVAPPLNKCSTFCNRFSQRSETYYKGTPGWPLLRDIISAFSDSWFGRQGARKWKYAISHLILVGKICKKYSGYFFHDFITYIPILFFLPTYQGHRGQGHLSWRSQTWFKINWCHYSIGIFPLNVHRTTGEHMGSLDHFISSRHRVTMR